MQSEIRLSISITLGSVAFASSLVHAVNAFNATEFTNRPFDVFNAVFLAACAVFMLSEHFGNKGS